jgi:hypothetical protein
MTCAEVRLIDSFLAEESLADTNHEVLAHVTGCHMCRALLDDRRRLRVPRGRGPRGEMAPRPEFPRVARDDARDWPSAARGRTLVAALASACAAAVVICAGLAGRAGIGALRLSALVHAAAGDHWDRAVAFRLAERPISLEDAARRFDPAFGSLAALELPAAGPRGPIRILERHACVFEGRRFAHLVLRYDGQLVSVLVGDGHRPGFSPSARQVNGVSVAAFPASRHAVLVVAALDSQQTLGRLIRSCRRRARARRQLDDPPASVLHLRGNNPGRSGYHWRGGPPRPRSPIQGDHMRPMMFS